MNGYYDYKKFAILYVDDEEKALRQLSLAFADTFWLLTAPDAAAGLKLLEAHKDQIAVLMSDERMPGERGVKFLERARQLQPRLIRILVTAYTDFDALIRAVNTGAIYKYISKPWEVEELEQVLRRALEFYTVQRERDQLLREKMATLHKTVIADRMISLGIVAAGLSHHVRNSLVAIRTFIELAPVKLEAENLNLERLHDPHYWKDFYGQVKTQMDRITGLLGDLQLLTDRAPHDPEGHARVGQALEQAQQRLRGRLDEKRIVVTHRIPADLPELKMELNDLERLFELLLQDELACLPDGCHVAIEARATPALGHLGASLQIEVRDDGPGLPEEQLRSVFDPFFIRVDKPQEFGIRLLACYFIVYHHGGRMEVRSQEGGGTTFLLSLPVEATPPATQSVEQDFLSKVMMNDTLWEKLLAEP